MWFKDGPGEPLLLRKIQSLELIQFNLSLTVTLGIEERDRCSEVVVVETIGSLSNKYVNDDENVS